MTPKVLSNPSNLLEIGNFMLTFLESGRIVHSFGKKWHKLENFQISEKKLIDMICVSIQTYVVARSIFQLFFKCLQCFLLFANFVLICTDTPLNIVAYVV